MDIRQAVIEGAFAELTTATPSEGEAVHLHFDGDVSTGTDYASTEPSEPTTVLAYWSAPPRTIEEALYTACWLDENIEELL